MQSRDRRSGVDRRDPKRAEARKEVDRMKYEIGINTCDPIIRDQKMQDLRDFINLISDK